MKANDLDIRLRYVQKTTDPVPQPPQDVDIADFDFCFLRFNTICVAPPAFALSARS